MLKLPQHMSYSEKKDRINEVISDLGLVKVTDTKVGNWAYRGVSGGERRRVSIGVEVLDSERFFGSAHLPRSLPSLLCLF
jgi:ABC-type multidrug transport system ATPase subunit